MISAQTLRVCREGKPVSTFPDIALDEPNGRVRMTIHFCSVFTVALLLIGPVQLRAAETAEECRTRCEKLAEADHRVCSELPANPSCGNAVEVNRQQCHDYCGRTYPERSDPQGNDARPDTCDAESRACR
jgi:hypothetical protein